MKDCLPSRWSFFFLKLLFSHKYSDRLGLIGIFKVKTTVCYFYNLSCTDFFCIKPKYTWYYKVFRVKIWYCNIGIALDGDALLQEGITEKERLEETLRLEEAHEGYVIIWG